MTTDSYITITVSVELSLISSICGMEVRENAIVKRWCWLWLHGDISPIVSSQQIPWRTMIQRERPRTSRRARTWVSFPSLTSPDTSQTRRSWCGIGDWVHREPAPWPEYSEWVHCIIHKFFQSFTRDIVRIHCLWRGRQMHSHTFFSNLSINDFWFETIVFLWWNNVLILIA